MVPVEGEHLQELEKDFKNLSDECEPLMMSLGTCHSLIMINGKLGGDVLDAIMFNALGWEYVEDFVNDHNEFIHFPERVVKSTLEGLSKIDDRSVYYGIFRQFPFESQLQRMTVVVQKSHSPSYYVIMKGAPEMVLNYCSAKSVPENFDTVFDGKLHFPSFENCS